MESRIKDNSKEIEPFTIEIDIDNRDELNYLWNLFNEATPATHKRSYKQLWDVEKISRENCNFKVWKLLNNKIKGGE